MCGYNRYATAAAVAREGDWPAGGAVVLARGDDFRDALSASGLAGLLGAPVVTMPSGEGSRAFESGMRAAANAIGRLQPSAVYVMGGEKALPPGLVERACAQAPGAEVVRVSGSNARLTSAAVLEAGLEAGHKWSDTALVVTQQGFKDAVAAAPLAYALHMPIVLARDEAAMDAAVVREMAECGITKAYLVGGPRALGRPVVDALERGGVSVLGEGEGPAYRGKPMRRLAGRTAVETSMAVAEFGISQGLSASTVGVATTRTFPDALSGAALCGRAGGVMVLAADEGSASVTKFVPAHAPEVGRGYVFGGSAVVSRATFEALVDATSGS